MKADSVKKKEAKPMTIEERRAELEAKIAELEVMQKVGAEILELADTYKQRYENYLYESVEDGKEEEQAKNYNGDLLYNVYDGETYEACGITEAKLTEKGYTVTDSRVTPHYRTKYKKVPVNLEDLDSWDKPRALVNKKLAEFFTNLDPMTLFED